MEKNIEINTGNQISKEGKIIGGILTILFLVIPIIVLTAYWPDKLPDSNKEAIYRDKWFHMSLIKIDSFSKTEAGKLSAVKEPSVLPGTAKNDTAKDKDSTVAAHPSPTANIEKPKPVSNTVTNNNAEKLQTIHLNTILLILVAVAGFLGSMIHVSSSFINFIGAESFKSSWTLWYIVKPFIGAALAVVIYFVFRAGFFNFNDPSNINIYGLVTFSAFAGLFTDNATLKLKEIFEVIFKAKDNRPNKLEDDQIRITGIKPEKLTIDSKNNLIVSGSGLDRGKLILKINDQVITDSVIKGDSISFSYNIPEALKNSKEFKVAITDDKGKEIYSKNLGI